LYSYLLPKRHAEDRMVRDHNLRYKPQQHNDEILIKGSKEINEVEAKYISIS
jgi:hypothetical protein